MVTLVEKVEYATQVIAFGMSREPENVFFYEIHNEPVTVLDAFEDQQGRPTVIFEFTPNKEMRNHFNFVHGGALTTVLDWYASLSQAADEKYYWGEEDKLPDIEQVFRFAYDFGLSRNLKSQFLRPIPVDDTFVIRGRVLSNTKNGACVSITMMSKDGKKIYFEGMHDKIKTPKMMPKRDGSDEQPAAAASEPKHGESVAKQAKL